MSLELCLIDLLSAGTSKIVKFSGIGSDGKQYTYFATDYNKETGTFLDVISEQRVPHKHSVSYLQERDDNFATEIKKIRQYLDENKDDYIVLFYEQLLAGVDLGITTINRCRLFEYRVFESAKNVDETFFNWAKKKWKDLIDKRLTEILSLLEVDKATFLLESNREGAEEIEEILKVLAKEYKVAVEKIETVNDYFDLIKIWPVILLPRPKAV